MNNSRQTRTGVFWRWMLCGVACLLTVALPAQNRIEYFWNTDPGIGRATKVGGGNGEVSFQLSTEQLPYGANLLGIRALSGQYASYTITKIIYKSPMAHNTGHVEYFWDEDPGVGRATVCPAAFTDGDAMFSIDLPTAGLSGGMHLLGLRAYNGSGWTSTYTHMVAVVPDGGRIDRVEYFWDEDPGYGLATSLSFTGDTIALVNEDIPTPQEYGTHILVVRAQAGGHWSHSLVRTVCVNASPDFALPADTLCAGVPVAVTNLTTGATEQTAYAWDMNGDGKPEVTGAEDFMYTYEKAGEYVVTLAVKTVGDCETTCTKVVTVLDVATPAVTLTASATESIAGECVRFEATAQDAGEHPAYEWTVNGETVAEATGQVWETESLKDGDRVAVKVFSSNPCSLVDMVESEPITITVHPVVYLVTVTAGEGGSVTGGGSYEEGATVTLMAQPDEGYAFFRWSDGVTDNPYVFTVTTDVTLGAEFVLQTGLAEAVATDVVDVYSVTGVRIKNHVPAAEWRKGLLPGIYIVDGTKRVVR